MDNKIKEMRLKSVGITCTGCAGDMEKILAEKDGIVDVSVNFVEDNIVIRYDPDVIDRKNLYIAVRKLGYPLKIVSET